MSDTNTDWHKLQRKRGQEKYQAGRAAHYAVKWRVANRLKVKRYVAEEIAFLLLERAIDLEPFAVEEVKKRVLQEADLR